MPLTLCVGSYESRQSYLLEEPSGCLDLSGELHTFAADQKCNWVKLNVDQAGFYRVKYDDELATRLTYAVQKKQLSIADRFGNWSLLGLYFSNTVSIFSILYGMSNRCFG